MRVHKPVYRHSPVIALAILLATSIFLNACLTNGSLDNSEEPDSGDTVRRVSQTFYSPFFDQGDHLAKLVKDGYFDDAATLFGEQTAYIAIPKNRKDNNATLHRIAANFNSPIASAISQNLKALSVIQSHLPTNKWAKTKLFIIQSKNTAPNYPDLAILRDPDFRLASINSMSEETRRVTNLLERYVNIAIANIDHFGEISFFDAYPISVNSRQALGPNFDILTEKVDKATATELEQFLQNYPPKTSFSVELYDRASRAYRKHLIA